jgi:ppGpp synthetase/RelA/SpoT-type nucleotidyltranferase
MTDYASVSGYLEQFRTDYLDLLGKVVECCRTVQAELGSDVVANVYTRPDTGSGPFKDVRGIVMKLRRQGARTAQSFVELGDVIGLTVVVQYPDQRDLFFGVLRSRLAGRVKVGEVERHENKNGYFAHHAICTRRYGVNTLRCEVQVKTLLHDAWSKKMHDLTYKPGGKLDARLKAMMIANATTIETVEQQSQLIRNMIQGGWDVERDARLAARESVFEQMLHYSGTIWKDLAEAEDIQSLHEAIEAGTEWLPEEAQDSDRLESLLERLEKVGGRPELDRFGWILSGRLASLRPDDHRLVRATIMHVDRWLTSAPEQLRSGAVTAREVMAVPLMFYLMGQLELSVDYADRLLANEAFAFDERTRAKLIFNRANSVVELEYHSPSQAGGDREELERQARAALVVPGLRDNEEIDASILDLEGLIDITFAGTTEQVRAGIVKVGAATAAAKDPERAVSDAYADLNMRRGWRRYFEVEAETRTA